MDAIIAPGTVTLAQADGPPATGTAGWATNGNPAAQVPATKFPAYHYNGLVQELLAVIIAGGLAPARASLTQLRDAIKAMISGAGPFVRQGGGAGQGTNQIAIGWDGTHGKLKAQVDQTDESNLAFEAWVGANYETPADAQVRADNAQAAAQAFTTISFPLVSGTGSNGALTSVQSLISGLQFQTASFLVPGNGTKTGYTLPRPFLNKVFVALGNYQASPPPSTARLAIEVQPGNNGQVFIFNGSGDSSNTISVLAIGN